MQAKLHVVVNRFPFLQERPLLLMLALEPLFLLAMGFTLLAVVTLLALLPKVWMATPPGFEPVVKISLLDRLQARTLARSARAQEAVDKPASALVAWDSAFANNPGDPDLVRGWMRCALKLSDEQRNSRTAAFHVEWLFRLTRTNTVDVPLAAALYERCGMDADVVRMTEALTAPWVPEVEAARLKALFRLGDLAGFDRLWSANPSRPAVDAELPLYRTAWGLMTAKDATERGPFLDRLENEAGKGGHAALANRLLTQVGVHLKQPPIAGRALARLVEQKHDRFMEHLMYWRLLLSEGDAAEAVRLMKAYGANPDSISETMAWAELWGVAGKPAEQEKLYQWALTHQEGAPPVFIEYATVLMRERRWSDLSNLALRLRSDFSAMPSLVSYSRYLEAEAEWHLGHEDAVARNLDFVREHGQEEPRLAILMCQGLTRMGQGGMGLSLLRKHESVLAEDAEYWKTLCLASEQWRDEASLTDAARRWHELRPNDIFSVVHYVNTLLIRRERLDEALRLTRAAMGAHPQEPALRLNHAWALLANHRPKEARALVQGLVKPTGLSVAESSQWELFWCELAVEEGDLEAARLVLKGIDPGSLFPNQRTWIEKRGLAAPASK